MERAARLARHVREREGMMKRILCKQSDEALLSLSLIYVPLNLKKMKSGNGQLKKRRQNRLITYRTHN